MTSTPPTDRQTFSADTLEQAMSAAVSEFGPGLTVLQAQKVRGGMRGLLGRDRYEVVAEGVPGRHSGPSAGLPGGQGDSAPASPGEAFSPITAAPDRTGPAATTAEPPRPAPAPLSEGPVVAVAGSNHVLDAVLSPPPAQLPEAARRRTPTPRASRTAPGWSRVELHRLGVPDAILAALPEADPADDLAWLVALTEAIASVVPPPAIPSPEEPAVLSGWGIKGAVALLEDGARGWPVGMLSDVGRSEPATAVELALAIRRHVLAGSL